MRGTVVRDLVREMILQEDEAQRRKNAEIASRIATGSDIPTAKRLLGRTLKDTWRKEADHASFRDVTFIHWQSLSSAVDLIRKPRGRDEVSAIPYRSKPWTPFTLGWYNPIGVILKGRPTLIANADLNSNAFTKKVIPNYEMSQEKKAQRQASSGWNKYPGEQSPGSSSRFFHGNPTNFARSWEKCLVYSADDIVPAEKIDFDAPSMKSSRSPMGWPEALIDNWRPVGIVVPDSVVSDFGIDVILDIFEEKGVPSGLPIYDQNGEERNETR
jgi:hypothetical protein